MSIASHAQKRLNRLYHFLLQNMRMLESLMERGRRMGGGMSTPPMATLENLEPKLLMSGAPVSPTDLIAAPVSISHVQLSWQDSAGDQTGFKVYESTDGQTYNLFDTVSDANATRYSVGGLTAGTQYFFEVSAVNDDGESDPTTVATVTTPSTAADDAAAAVDPRISGLTPSAALPQRVPATRYPYRSDTGQGSSPCRLCFGHPMDRLCDWWWTSRAGGHPGPTSGRRRPLQRRRDLKPGREPSLRPWRGRGSTRA